MLIKLNSKGFLVTRSVLIVLSFQVQLFVYQHYLNLVQGMSAVENDPSCKF